ncbi:LuxR C-terminal-related transcriptional regulator [Microbulbifer sp. OS29]|uniref:LuxR C-terminal-related transcriptional regulator n=1 Tax=Microbulbifer okhotskensis TaxID=2926617 RepID=A0A9X2J6Z4_9GAMM|nr:response regulator transcription factor family protein [Microbulbifer okhotskensis]MCO1335984.1 LuxR C-terminal-related transcriptional regulator [Microbulbifer okhotskensis]
MASVEAAGRQAMKEMRHLLGVLRPTSDDTALTPQPDLNDLPALIEKVRQVLSDVDYETHGALENMPSSVALAAYRIVQESLTNVIKHVGAAARVQVSLRANDGTLTIRVRDDGNTIGERPMVEASIDAQSGGGHGIAGMRERAELLGGYLLDIRMPEMDGLEATARILEAGDATCRIIILTRFDPDEYVFRALRAGASGFVLKDIPSASLVEAVRTVAEGGAMLASGITQRLISQFAQKMGTGRNLAERLERLTTREREVLEAIAAGKSNAAIAEALFIGPAAVKTHVSSLFSKLGLRDRAQTVVFAYECGLATVGERDVGFQINMRFATQCTVSAYRHRCSNSGAVPHPRGPGPLCRCLATINQRRNGFIPSLAVDVARPDARWHSGVELPALQTTLARTWLRAQYYACG